MIWQHSDYVYDSYYHISNVPRVHCNSTLTHQIEIEILETAHPILPECRSRVMVMKDDKTTIEMYIGYFQKYIHLKDVDTIHCIFKGG